MVERIAPFCGTAKTTPHNAVFLQGLRAALTADAAWMGGDYGEQPVLGMRAFSRVYAGWGLSQPFYKRELWRQMGFDSLADFLTGFWEKRYGRRDANGRSLSAKSVAMPKINSAKVEGSGTDTAVLSSGPPCGACVGGSGA